MLPKTLATPPALVWASSPPTVFALSDCNSCLHGNTLQSLPPAPTSYFSSCPDILPSPGHLISSWMLPSHPSTPGLSSPLPICIIPAGCGLDDCNSLWPGLPDPPVWPPYSSQRLYLSYLPWLPSAPTTKCKPSPPLLPPKHDSSHTELPTGPQCDLPSVSKLSHKLFLLLRKMPDFPDLNAYISTMTLNPRPRQGCQNKLRAPWSLQHSPFTAPQSLTIPCGSVSLSFPPLAVSYQETAPGLDMSPASTLGPGTKVEEMFVEWLTD